MLGAANGLAPQPYGPHPSTFDAYMAPGNYANAESVERGAEGDKCNWVAYSSYGEEDYMNSQDLAAKLEQVFAADELCQNVHATIYQNEIGIAHRVEYRFHTFGVELSEGPDGPDFCSSCGWNTQHIKCNAVPDHHPSEVCHYLCANCGMDTGIITPCIRQITFNMEIKSGAFLTRLPNVVSAVSSNVVNAAGEIVLGYGLAENNLRAMMVNVPGHKPGSNLSADIERLKIRKKEIVASASAKSADGGQAMEECINAIIDAFAKTRAKRNALTHGQLVQVGLSTLIIGGGNIDRDRDRGSRLQIEHDGETVELTEDGIQELLDNARKLQAHVGHLGEILEFLASR
jgi:hypothetical protein